MAFIPFMQETNYIGKNHKKYDLLKNLTYSNFKPLCLFALAFATFTFVIKATPTCVYPIFLRVP